MTKKDYKLIAKAINKTSKSGITNKVRLNKVLTELVRNIAPELKKDNRNFNSDKFKEACFE